MRKQPALENNNGVIRLKFVHPATQKRVSLSGFGKWDDKQAQATAEATAQQIWLDYQRGRFDPSLAKYKPESLNTGYLTVVPDIKPKIALLELWDSYVDYRLSANPAPSPNTVTKDWNRGVRAKLLKAKDEGIADDVIEFRDYLIRTTTIRVAKQTLNYLSNAFDYALERKLIASNECYGLAQKIKTPKSLRKTEDSEIKAFTKEERDLIINAFRTNPHRLIRHYADYVEFCFYTGARPCEVAALQWKHITSTHIKFEQDLVESETEKFTVKQGLKTQEKRQFPINPQLQAIVDSIRPDNVEPDAFVFLSSNGNHINLNKFSQRSWKTVLKGLKESHNIQPLSPYHTRHTFITMMIDNGVSAMDIKRWCGNSADIVLSRYASAKRDLVVPEM